MARSTGPSPIDFVMLWVDGNDPAWQEARARYAPALGSDARAERYRDWDILQYWFRGVERYAPWVRQIHFVTYGHLPPWLNAAHPKLRIVRHEAFLPADCLPTFSGRPLELNLHRLPGLAEQFVFFNDDMFLFAPVPPTAFFRGGLPCDMAIESPLQCREPTRACALANSLCVINSRFAKRDALRRHPWKWLNPRYGAAGLRNLLLLPWHSFVGFYDFHTPNAYVKATFEAAWAEARAVLEQTTRQRYRSNQDVVQALMKYWQLADGRFAPIRKRGTFVPLDRLDSAALARLARRRPRFVCFNDSADVADFEATRRLLGDFLEKSFPQRSAFEIDPQE